jgi:hypothetical protein
MEAGGIHVFATVRPTGAGNLIILAAARFNFSGFLIHLGVQMRPLIMIEDHLLNVHTLRIRESRF